MLATTRRGVHWAERLCHPVPMAAVLLMVLNDHVLKGSGLLPGVVTGKLSDVAGLFFFPLLCAALIQGAAKLAGRGTGDERRLAISCILFTGAIFSALKLSPQFNAIVSRFWGDQALDPTDLLALPSLGLAWLWMRRSPPRPARGELRLAALVAAGLASIATSKPRLIRVYPNWTIDGPARRALSCATAEVRVPKSGKEGAGVMLELRAAGTRCTVRVDSATLRLPSVQVPAASLPGVIEVPASGVQYAWLAFTFDGDAAWNSGEHRATLRLQLQSGEQDEVWEVELFNQIEGGEQIQIRPWGAPDRRGTP